MNMLAKAIAIAAEAFKTKLDKGGEPYMMHCIRVLMAVSQEDEDTRCAAILHDVVEDCEKEGYTFDYLREQGFNHHVIYLLMLLTHEDGEDYMSYIRRLAVDDRARKIKMADLHDNSDITRLKGVRQKDFERAQKYNIAYMYLKN